MKTETPRTDAIRDCINCDAMSDEFSTWYIHSVQLERELNAVLLDKQRLDALESVPFALEIKYDPNQPKADSLASLRSQIDYFLAQRAAAKPNK